MVTVHDEVVTALIPAFDSFFVIKIKCSNEKSVCKYTHYLMIYQRFMKKPLWFRLNCSTLLPCFKAKKIGDNINQIGLTSLFGPI